MNTGTSKEDLVKIWNIVDSGKDGSLNRNQFIIGLGICDVLKKTGKIVDNLPTVE